jgi:methionyl-tRNA formyltransferase
VTPVPEDVAAGGRPTRTIFLGSGTFALPILQALATHPAVVLVGVVAPPDRPAGRHGASTPVPVAAEGRRLGIPLLQPVRIRTPEATAAIRSLAPDLGVLADFGRIIPLEMLELPRHGILNIHPSLLPRHRGASPVPATILAGDRLAGVSVMLMDAGLDTGPVLAARSWPLSGTETAPVLEARAAVEGAGLLVDVLEPYLHGERVPVPQDDRGATVTPLLRRTDGLLDPARRSGELERQVRAYLPWPGSFVEVSTGRLAVLRAAVTPGGPGDRPGLLVADGDGLALVATDGRLKLLEVQPAGGRPMSGAAFRRGHPAILGQDAGGAA